MILLSNSQGIFNLENVNLLSSPNFNPKKWSCLFKKKFTKVIKIDKYLLGLIGYMGVTPMSFNVVPQRSFGKKGIKSVVIRTSGLYSKEERTERYAI